MTLVKEVCARRDVGCDLGRAQSDVQSDVEMWSVTWSVWVLVVFDSVFGERQRRYGFNFPHEVGLKMNLSCLCV